MLSFYGVSDGVRYLAHMRMGHYDMSPSTRRCSPDCRARTGRSPNLHTVNWTTTACRDFNKNKHQVNLCWFKRIKSCHLFNFKKRNNKAIFHMPIQSVQI